MALVDIAFPHIWANILESTEIQIVLERITNAQTLCDSGAAGIEVASSSTMTMFRIQKGHYSTVPQLCAIMFRLYQKGLFRSTPSRAGKQEFFLEFTHNIFTGRARLHYYGNARTPAIHIKFKTKSTSLLA